MNESWSLLSGEPCDERLPIASVADIQEYVVVRALERRTGGASGGAEPLVVPNDHVVPLRVSYEMMRLTQQALVKGNGADLHLPTIEALRGGVSLAHLQKPNADEVHGQIVEVDVRDVGEFVRHPEAAGEIIELSEAQYQNLFEGRDAVVSSASTNRILVLRPGEEARAQASVDVAVIHDLQAFLAHPVVQTSRGVRHLDLSIDDVQVLARSGETTAEVGTERIALRVAATEAASEPADDGVAFYLPPAMILAPPQTHAQPTVLANWVASSQGGRTPEQIPLPNFELVLCQNYVQEWRLVGYARGRLVNSLALAPQEEVTIEISTWNRRTATTEVGTQTESSGSTEAMTGSKHTAEVVGQLTDTTNWKLTVGGDVSVPLEPVKIGAKIQNELGEQTVAMNKGTLTRINDATTKAARVVRSQRTTKVTETREWGTESRSVRKLRNGNVGRTVTYDLFETVARYDVVTHAAPDSLRIGVQVPLPLEAEIDRWFLLRHEGVLRAALTDPTRADGFGAARWLETRELWEREVARQQVGGTSGANGTAPESTERTIPAAPSPAEPTAVSNTAELTAASTQLLHAIQALRRAGYKRLADLYDRPWVGSGRPPESEWRAAELEWRRYLYRRYGLESFASLFWTACLAFEQETSRDRWAVERLIRSTTLGILEAIGRSLTGTLQVVQVKARIVTDLVVLNWKAPPMALKAGLDDAGLGVALSRARRELQRIEAAEKRTSAAPAIAEAAVAAAGGVDSEPTAATSAPVPPEPEEPFPLEEWARQQVNENALLEHINLHRDYYLGAIWEALPRVDQQRYLTLYEHATDFVDPRALTVLNGRLILPLREGVDKNADQALAAARDRLADHPEQDVREVILPTDGLHVETRLGGCDVIEEFVVRHRGLDLDLKRVELEHKEAERDRHLMEVRRLEARLVAEPPLLDGGSDKAALTVELKQSKAGE